MTEGAGGLPHATAVAVSVAAVVFVASAVAPEHHWDEYFYLFSASRHSTTDLLRIEGALSDGILPNGFFSGKLGFVVLLEQLLKLTGTGETGLAALRTMFLVMGLGLAGASWLLLKNLVHRNTALEAAIVLLVLPLSIYCGFKSLSEVPSLLISTLGGWQFTRAVRAWSAPKTRAHLVAAAALLGLGIVMRLTSGLFAAGLIVATIVIRPHGASWRRVAGLGVVAIGGAIALSTGLYLAVLGSPLERFAGLAASVTGRSPGPAVRLYAITMFGQLFLPFVALSLWPPVCREVRAALLWLMVATVPFLVSAQYVEPRFFYTGLVPLAILAHAGLVRFATWWRPATRVATGATVLALVVLMNRVTLAPFMPYELRESDYGGLIRDVGIRHQSPTYVTPWLSDFCYLAVAFPQERTVLSMSRTYGTGRVFGSPAFREWLGEASHVGTAAELEAVRRPWIYVGWDYNPTVVAIDRLLRPAGLAVLDDQAYRATLLNHLTPSWIWTDPRFRLEPLATRGAYRAFWIRESGGV